MGRWNKDKPRYQVNVARQPGFHVVDNKDGREIKTYPTFNQALNHVYQINKNHT
jgi:hypothetical protein